MASAWPRHACSAGAGGRRNRSRRRRWPRRCWPAFEHAGAAPAARGGCSTAPRRPTCAPLTLRPGDAAAVGQADAAGCVAGAARTTPFSTVLSPTKPATKRLAGASYRRSTRSTCWIAPSLNTATRSRHRQRFGLVVRDVDEGHAQAAVQFLQLDLHVLAQLLVQRAERLVHQHQLRLEHQRARQRHALLLPARELRGIARAQLAQLHHVERRAPRSAPRCAPLMPRTLSG